MRGYVRGYFRIVLTWNSWRMKNISYGERSLSNSTFFCSNARQDRKNKSVLEKRSHRSGLILIKTLSQRFTLSLTRSRWQFRVARRRASFFFVSSSDQTGVCQQQQTSRRDHWNSNLPTPQPPGGPPAGGGGVLPPSVWKSGLPIKSTCTRFNGAGERFLRLAEENKAPGYLAMHRPIVDLLRQHLAG